MSDTELTAPEGMGIPEKPRYRIYHPLLLSFFSGALYRDVALKWGWRIAGYIFLLIVLSWIPATVVIQSGVSRFFSAVQKNVLSQLPTIEIVDSKFAIDQPMPIIIREPISDTRIVVIDTSDSPLPLPSAPFILTKDQVSLTFRGREPFKFNLKKLLYLVGDHAITPQMIGSFIAEYEFFFFYLLPSIILISIVKFLTLALTYAGISLVVFSIFDISMYFTTAFRIAVLALSPAYILSTILGALALTPPLWFLFSILITLGYLAFGFAAVGFKDH